MDLPLERGCCRWLGRKYQPVQGANKLLVTRGDECGCTRSQIGRKRHRLIGEPPVGAVVVSWVRRFLFRLEFYLFSSSLRSCAAQQADSTRSCPAVSLSLATLGEFHRYPASRQMQGHHFRAGARFLLPWLHRTDCDVSHPRVLQQRREKCEGIS